MSVRLKKTAKIRKLQRQVRDLRRRVDHLEELECRVRRVELACQAAGAAMLTPAEAWRADAS